jgi:hypothetical protein
LSHTHTSYKKTKHLLLTMRPKIVFCFVFYVFSLFASKYSSLLAHTQSLKTTISPGGGDAGGKRLPIANFFFIQSGHVQTRLFTNHGCSLGLLCLYICECYYLPCAPLITPDRSKHTHTATEAMTDGCARHMINKK